MERLHEGPWWFAINQRGEQVGPLARIDVLDMLRRGLLSPSSLVWRQGLSEWTRADTLPEFAMPPPVPAPAEPPLLSADAKPAANTGFFGGAFKKVEDENDARKRLNDAGLVTFVFAGMQALGGVLFVYQQTNSDDQISGGIGFAAIVIALLFAGFALRRGKGGVTLPLAVLSLFVFEIVYKVLVTPHPSLVFWMFLYAVIGGSIASGVRGALFLRRRRKAYRHAY